MRCSNGTPDPERWAKVVSEGSSPSSRLSQMCQLSSLQSRVCLHSKLQEEKVVSPIQRYQIAALNREHRSGAGRHRTSEVHVTQLEQENQNLRMQLATSSTRPTSPDHTRQPSFSNVSSAGSTGARNETFPPPLTRAYSSPPSSSTGGEEEWRGTSGEIPSSATSTSTFLGMTPAILTPASVLVHAPDRAGEGMEGAGDATSKMMMGDRNTARQRLETEAGIQRK